MQIAELAIKLNVWTGDERTADKPTLRQHLDTLWTDVVSPDADIHDGHPRFYEHVSLMAVAGDLWPDLQERMDDVKVNDLTEANAIERAAIRRIVTQILGK